MSSDNTRETLDQRFPTGVANDMAEAIRRLVSEEVEARVQKETLLLKDSIAIAAKIIGAAIAC